MSYIELSIDVNYLPDWGISEGVRELVQNGLDAKTQHGGEFSCEYVDGTLFLENSLGAVSREAFLLGNTSKANDDATIGHFGEGLKLGVLALVRAGCNVSICAGNALWNVSIRPSSFYKADVLCLEEFPTRMGHGGTLVLVHGIDEEQWQSIRQQFLMYLPHERLGSSPMLVTPELQGKVFVGGILVTELEGMRYGYDFLPQTVDTDRDRKLIDGTQLSNAITLEWASYVNKHPEAMEMLYTLLNGGGADITYEAASDFTWGPVRAALWNEYAKRHAEQLPVYTDDQRGAAETSGLPYVIVAKPLGVVLHQFWFGFNTMLDRHRHRVVHAWKQEDLNSIEIENLNWAISLLPADLLLHVTVVDFSSSNVYGLYHTADRVVSIARRLLVDRYETLATLIHEFNHVFGWDGSRAHVDGIERTWTTLFKKEVERGDSELSRTIRRTTKSTGSI